MLEFQLPNTTTLIREGITCFRCDASINVEDTTNEIDYCFCDVECETPLIQFASNEEREKDYFTLYYKSKDDTSTTQYFIDDTELIDGVHGVAITSGFEVDFTKIYNTLGGGDYSLKMEVTEWGATFEKVYKLFKVAPFNLLRANGTVKIEAFQSGEIEKSFNFENENVKFSLRIDGILTNKTQITELIDTPDGSRRTIQVHDRFYYEYDLIFSTNKYDFSNLVLENLIIGTTLFVSDYNLQNQTRKEPFNKIPLRLIETESEHIKGTNTTQYTIKLRDALQNGIKHPYIENC